jgi:hypothetical protein
MAGTDRSDDGSDLREKIGKWLSSEGYPLEFVAANIARKFKFRVWQGQYVRDTADVAREIDVLASMDVHNGDYLIRGYQVIECKWSQDKPWVVFTSPFHRMAQQACATQTIASFMGSGVLWALAGDKRVMNTSLFVSPERPGFNGRQAFSKGEDRFYSAMKSITHLSSLLVDRYDEYPRIHGQVPRCCVFALPIILVDGRLFEAFYSEASQSTELSEVTSVRCHWRGAPNWDHHATVDIVTLAHFETFMRIRSEETKLLLEQCLKTHQEIEQCFKEKSLRALMSHLAREASSGCLVCYRRLRPKPRTLRSQRSRFLKARSALLR